MALQKAQLETILPTLGWTRDRWGYWRNQKYRIGLSRVGVRFEVRNDEIPKWVRLASGYWRDIELVEQPDKGILLSRMSREGMGETERMVNIRIGKL